MISEFYIYINFISKKLKNIIIHIIFSFYNTYEESNVQNCNPICYHMQRCCYHIFIFNQSMTITIGGV